METDKSQDLVSKLGNHESLWDSSLAGSLKTQEELFQSKSKGRRKTMFQFEGRWAVGIPSYSREFCSSLAFN